MLNGSFFSFTLFFISLSAGLENKKSVSKLTLICNISFVSLKLLLDVVLSKKSYTEQIYKFKLRYHFTCLTANTALPTDR